MAAAGWHDAPNTVIILAKKIGQIAFRHATR
jgi:hypothetical protein